MTEIQTQQRSEDGLEMEFVRVIIIVVVFTVGVMFFLFSLALMKDLATLTQAPELVWAFICGVPNEDGPALPLMLTLSTLALLSGVVLTIWHLWKLKTDSSHSDT